MSFTSSPWSITLSGLKSVQISEGGKDAEDVRECMLHREGTTHGAVGPPPLLEDSLQRLAADVLHHDVSGAGVLHEVVDPDHAGVLDASEELTLGQRRVHRVRIAGVEQALQDHPAVRHLLVLSQVDPAQPAVG